MGRYHTTWKPPNNDLYEVQIRNCAKHYYAAQISTNKNKMVQTRIKIIKSIQKDAKCANALVKSLEISEYCHLSNYISVLAWIPGRN